MGLKLREIGFHRTCIFKIFRGSMPPDPPTKVRLRRTILFSITYEHSFENLSYAPGRCAQAKSVAILAVKIAAGRFIALGTSMSGLKCHLDASNQIRSIHD